MANNMKIGEEAFRPDDLFFDDDFADEQDFEKQSFEAAREEPYEDEEIQFKKPEKKEVTPEMEAKMDEVFAQICATRELTLEQLEDAREYFRPQLKEYEDYDTIKNVRLPRFVSRFGVFLVWGIILIVIGVAARSVLNLLNESELFATILQVFPVEAILKVAKIFIIVGIIFIAIKVLYEIIRLIVILISNHSLKQLRAYLVDNYRASPFVGTIGFDYSDPFIIDEMIKAVRDGRANTLPEAMSAYELSKLIDE